MYTDLSPLLGPPHATIDQCTQWFLTQPHGEYKDYDLAEVIIPAYWRVCLTVGIDPVLALAQLAVETSETISGKRGPLQSFWSRRRWRRGNDSGNLRNPAGVGVDGSHQVMRPTNVRGWAYNDQRGRWEKGVSFPTWADDAIPAHVGRLLAYATLPVQRTEAQRQLVEKALSYRDLRLDFQGTAPVLRFLGKKHNPKGALGAGWAGKDRTEGGGYGVHIAQVANGIVG